VPRGGTIVFSSIPYPEHFPCKTRRYTTCISYRETLTHQVREHAQQRCRVHGVEHRLAIQRQVIQQPAGRAVRCVHRAEKAPALRTSERGVSCTVNAIQRALKGCEVLVYAPSREIIAAIPPRFTIGATPNLKRRFSLPVRYVI
jgi:hypothetical protein